MKEGSWNRRWTYCAGCDEVTPHIPYFQNWGSASPKCEICKNVNLFKNYHDIDCEALKLNLKKNWKYIP